MSWIVEVEDPITKDWITKEFDNNHMQAGIEWALNISAKYYIYHS